MMNRIILYIIIGLTALLSSSCLRDDLSECPALVVEVSVKDKNYSNVDDVEQESRVAEDLPFKSYISRICWTLRSVETGEIVAEHTDCDVTDEDETIKIDFGNELAFGQYELTIWGNLTDHAPLGDDPHTIDFHPGNNPGDDIYMTSDLIDYQIDGSVHQVEMERTKGKLIIEKINVPSDLTLSEKSIRGIYGSMDHTFKYAGETQVNTSTVLDGSGNYITSSILAPSISESGAVVSLRISGEPTRSFRLFTQPADVNVHIRRNELTVLRYVWDDTTDQMRVFTLVDSGWEEFFELEL